MKFPILFALSVIATVLGSAAPLSPVFGVSEGDEKLYTQNTFACKDGSAIIPKTRVNDDYCDCADGSDEPGTAACVKGHFYCQNKGHFGMSLLSSRVNDGICDCCDGSDEYNGFTTCKNTCAEEHEEWMKQNNQRLTTFSKGSTILREWVRESKEVMDNMAAKKEELQSDIETIKQDIELAKKELEILRANQPEEKPAESGERACDEERYYDMYKRMGLLELQENELRYLIVSMLSHDNSYGNEGLDRLRDYADATGVDLHVDDDLHMDDVRQMSAEHAEAKESEAVKAKEREVTELENSLSSKESSLKDLESTAFYGPANEFYKMKGQCYSKQFNKYTYRVCPYSTSFQDSTSVGDHFEIVDATGAKLEGDVDFHQSLESGASSKDVYFHWTNGRSCWNGPKRSLKLKLVCHDSVELLLLTEPSMCVYEGDLGTPAVCPL